MTIDSHDKDADRTDHVQRLIDDAAAIDAADLLEAVEVAIKIEASRPTPGIADYVDDVLARAEAGDPVAVAIVEAARAPVFPTPAAFEDMPSPGHLTPCGAELKRRAVAQGVRVVDVDGLADGPADILRAGATPTDQAHAQASIDMRAGPYTTKDELLAWMETATTCSRPATSRRCDEQASCVIAKSRGLAGRLLDNPESVALQLLGYGGATSEEIWADVKRTADLGNAVSRELLRQDEAAKRAKAGERS